MTALVILLLLDLAGAMSVPGPAYVVVGTIYFAVHAVLGVMDNGTATVTLVGSSPMSAPDATERDTNVRGNAGYRPVGNGDRRVARHRRSYRRFFTHLVSSERTAV